MSIETIYIDSADEITGVIERLKASHEPIVALVVPKGAVLTQSIVNLKLAKKAAADAQKDLILVTTDKIGKNLAAQVGINVAASEKEVAKVASGQLAGSDEESASVIAGVRIHRYYDEGDPEEQESAGQPAVSSQVAEVAAATPIVPKTLLQDTEEVVAKDTPEIETSSEKVVLPETSPLTRKILPEEPINTTSKKSEPAVPVSAQKPLPDGAAAALTPKTKVNKRPLVIVGVFILLLSLLSSLFFLPITTVTLTVAAKGWDQEVIVTANKDTGGISSDGTKIPVETLLQEGEVTSSFQSTGTKRVGVAAKGTATIFNSQDSASQTLAAGAKLEANGRTFTTNEAVSVPGVTVKSGKLIPGSATVGITAENVGTESNVSGLAANITSPSTNLYAQIESTSGGSSQELKIVSSADITNAKNTLAKQLRDQLVAKITESLANREVVFQDGADTLTDGSFTTSLEVGAEGESFQATTKGRLERLVADKATLTDALATYFKNTETSTEKRLVTNTEVTATLAAYDTKTLTISTKSSGKITPVFATDTLPSQLVGKSLSDGQAIVAGTTPASSSSIKQSPSWWPLKQFPRFAGSITITTTYE